MKPSISIIILTWNRPQTLKKVWDCNVLPILSYNPEVIIVDQGSERETSELIRSWQPQSLHLDIIHMLLPYNYGYGKGMNQGLRVARGWYLVTMDDDILLPIDWLPRGIEALDAVPQLGFLGWDWGLTHHSCWIGKKERCTINGVELVVVDKAFGNNIFRRDFFDQIGYYDELFEIYGIEDTDWYRRSEELGFINAYLPGPMAAHIGPTSDNRAMKDYYLRRNAARYNEKWAQKDVPLFHSPWEIASDEYNIRRQLEGLGYL